LSVRNRRQAREAALSALYLIELGDGNAEKAFVDLEAIQELPEVLREFAEKMVRGVLKDRQKIDAIIQSHLHDWDVSRLATIDRIVLRMACFELYSVDDVPPKVSLDEAIEMAKKYSTAESGKFVNGVLGAILPKSPKADWQPPGGDTVEAPAPPSPEPDVETLDIDAPETKELAKVGRWKLRTEEPAE
jgi:transcription antitermination protein NusB